mmetsp:Transcript_55291/g.135651  ORF Transcript_55291/g.135651 Transcript_55291/m.135651 type:complete len:318 (+) Transcript_55291:995-1948(+)
MEKLYRFEELPCVFTHLLDGKRPKLASPQDVVQARTELFKDHACVSAILKPREQLDAVVPVFGIVSVKVGKDFDFDACGLAILGNSADHLDGDGALLGKTPALEDLAKGALTQQAQDTIAALRVLGAGPQTIANAVNNVAVLIVARGKRVDDDWTRRRAHSPDGLLVHLGRGLIRVAHARTGAVPFLRGVPLGHHLRRHQGRRLDARRRQLSAALPRRARSRARPCHGHAMRIVGRGVQHQGQGRRAVGHLVRSPARAPRHARRTVAHRNGLVAKHPRGASHHHADAPATLLPTAAPTPAQTPPPPPKRPRRNRPTS